MKPNRSTKTIRLTAMQSEALNKIALELKAFSRSGPTTGDPSWSVLVSKIADGDFIVSIPGIKREIREKKAKKPRKPFRACKNYPPKWWTPNRGGQMELTDAITASNLTVEELKAGGMIVIEWMGENRITVDFEQSGWNAWSFGNGRNLEPQPPGDRSNLAQPASYISNENDCKTSEPPLARDQTDAPPYEDQVTPAEVEPQFWEVENKLVAEQEARAGELDDFIKDCQSSHRSDDV